MVDGLVEKNGFKDLIPMWPVSGNHEMGLLPVNRTLPEKRNHSNLPALVSEGSRHQTETELLCQADHIVELFKTVYVDKVILTEISER